MSNRAAHRLIAFWITLAMLVGNASASQETEHGHGHAHATDFLLFVDGRATHDIAGSDEDKDATLAGAFMFSHSIGRFRLLSEYAYSDEENEMERLQLGWQINDSVTVWLGRYHNPDNYWNDTFHHGQYLHTPISRPWLDKFEDEGGPFASHTTGMLVEYLRTADDGAALQFKWGIGAGAHYEQDLEPFDIFNPSSNHDLSTQMRMAYLPDIARQNQIGLLASYQSIHVNQPTAPGSFGRIHQRIVGAYFDWQFTHVRAISALKYISNDLQAGGGDSFWGGYLYGETRLSGAWQSYARIDTIHDSEGSRYLGLLDESQTGEYALGVRWDLMDRHALSLELQKRRFDLGEDRTNVILQWSAAFF